MCGEVVPLGWNFDHGSKTHAKAERIAAEPLLVRHRRPDVREETQRCAFYWGGRYGLEDDWDALWYPYRGWRGPARGWGNP